MKAPEGNVITFRKYKFLKVESISATKACAKPSAWRKPGFLMNLCYNAGNCNQEGTGFWRE